jgi:16S rRNA (guanine966-N2)-methyltransferase
MRIVGGKLSGRKITPPLSQTTRPMMDRVRVSLFNILLHHDWGNKIGKIFDGETHALDAFCGTGALAFEALSHGAAYATLFDTDQEALMVAKRNAAHLGVLNDCQILLADALAPPKAPKSCKLIFLSPPYNKGLIAPAVPALDKAGWIEKHAVIVAEVAKKEEFLVPEGFTLKTTRTYGIATLHFLVR